MDHRVSGELFLATRTADMGRAWGAVCLGRSWEGIVVGDLGGGDGGGKDEANCGVCVVRG